MLHSPRPRPFKATAALFVPLSLALCAIAPAARAIEPTGTAIEYFNASLNHYFMTALPQEAAMLDAGNAVQGWKRTGIEFRVWTSPGDAPGIFPVCRFYSHPNSGANTHVYTADPAECAHLQRDASWIYEGTAFHVALPQSGTCAPGTQPIWRSFNPGQSATQWNHRFVPDLTVAQKMTPPAIPEGVVMCAPMSSAQVRADAVRLLEQSTFGPTDALADHVAAVGARAFLDEQFNAPASRYPDIKYVPAGAQSTFCPTDPNPYCGRDYYTLFLLQNAFFANAVTAPDQLRQRVAFALSQILVTSGIDINLAYAMARYQQTFLDHAFGNYADILARVTLSPVMGDYLDMVNNDKPAQDVNPNENYARELLQLFSIGVWELNLDGTRRVDIAGQPIPSYDQDTIEGFAHVFTGWTYPALAGATARTHNPRNYLSDMVGVSTNHATASKVLLNGATAPAGLAMDADLAFALRNVMNHPNLGPFVGRQLIQKLVTGDPSPQYVARVASVFNNNGSGVRGDLKAVVAAILTDPEARGPVKYDPGFGKLREPVLYVAGLARALGSRTDGVAFAGQTRGMGQDLFSPPSVFNYYPPTYTLPGTSLVAPEFALQNSTTSISRYNFVNTLAFGSIPPSSSVPGAIGTLPDWNALASVAGNTDALISRLDALLMHGTMTDAMKAALRPAINAVATTDLLTRAKTAFYLVATSPQYQVER